MLEEENEKLEPTLSLIIVNAGGHKMPYTLGHPQSVINFTSRSRTHFLLSYIFGLHSFLIKSLKCTLFKTLLFSTKANTGDFPGPFEFTHQRWNDSFLLCVSLVHPPVLCIAHCLGRSFLLYHLISEKPWGYNLLCALLSRI
jgi:hypothetical protein